jgi:LPXTG-motif cell wall-anchored protein
LAAPAAALAQGAGDDQYSDPFGSGQNDDSGSDDGGGAEPEPEPEPSEPESTTEAPAPTPAPAPEATASQQEPAEQLPYTGADEGLVALAGVMLLAGGVALRLRLR